MEQEFLERNKGESSTRHGIERENFPAGRKRRKAEEGGGALLVMELLAATQDKCPTYVQSGGREGGREGEREERAAAPLRKWLQLQMPGVDRCDGSSGGQTPTP